MARLCAACQKNPHTATGRNCAECRAIRLNDAIGGGLVPDSTKTRLLAAKLNNKMFNPDLPKQPIIATHAIDKLVKDIEEFMKKQGPTPIFVVDSLAPDMTHGYPVGVLENFSMGCHTSPKSHPVPVVPESPPPVPGDEFPPSHLSLGLVKDMRHVYPGVADLEKWYYEYVADTENHFYIWLAKPIKKRWIRVERNGRDIEAYIGADCWNEIKFREKFKVGDKIKVEWA